MKLKGISSSKSLMKESNLFEIYSLVCLSASGIEEVIKNNWTHDGEKAMLSGVDGILYDFKVLI